MIDDTSHGLDDVLVAGAAAEIRREGVANLGLSGFRVIAKICGQGHQDAGRAKAALQAMRFLECGLQGMELAIRGRQALNSLDGVAVRLDRQHDARPRGLAIEQDRARAANAMLTTNVRAGEAKVLAQEIAEQQARLHVLVMSHAVDSGAQIHGGVILSPWLDV